MTEVYLFLSLDFQDLIFWKVHHIDPKGQDSGVVYSEMQGRENTSGDLMALRFVQYNPLDLLQVDNLLLAYSA